VTLVSRVAVPVVHVARAFVDVIVVHAVDVPVVREVGVVAVRDRDMAAVATMQVVMAGMGAMGDSSGHDRTPHSRRRKVRQLNLLRHQHMATSACVVAGPPRSACLGVVKKRQRFSCLPFGLWF
jgi:hypothetical protein